MMRKKIRVLQAIRQGQIGGGESHVLNLVNFLDKEQFEPVVLSFTPGPMVDKLRSAGIRTYVINARNPLHLQMWQQVRTLLREERIDLIHAHGSRANMNIAWAARQSHIPVIYTVHGWSFHPDQSFLVRNARLTAERMLTRWSEQTITVSDSNHQTGQQLISGFQSKVVFNGIDTKRFHPDQSFKNVRAEYGIPAEHTLVVFVARMTIQKDPLTMLQAFKPIAERYPDVTLLMIGQGELDQAVTAAIDEYGLRNRVVRDGFRLDVPDVLNAADVYCLPSLWEGQPIGLIEAMAIGKAVIATHVDGSKELVKDGVNGLLIDPQQPQQLADAIERLHTDSQLRKKLAAQAFQTVTDRYNAASMTRQIETIYQRIAQATPVGPVPSYG